MQLFYVCSLWVKDGDSMELDRDEILETLRRVALSRPNDAISLALQPGDTHVGSLDLWGVSEFKMSSAGAVEVKFLDRIKALSLLLESAGGGGDSMDALLNALEAEDE